MQRSMLILALFLLLPVFVFSQVVSIYCTWDDLEAARQQRIFGSGIVEMIRQAGYTVTDKSFPNQAAADNLITSDIILVIGSSHGDTHTFYDCNDWSAIWTSRTPKHLGPMNGKFVHLLACLNGQNLAPTMVSEGKARVVLAYRETFNFSYESKYNDLNARADAEFDRALIVDNCTAEDAYLLAKNMFLDFANQASNEGNSAEYETFVHNANCISLFGDKSARLRPTSTTTRTVARISPKKLEKPSKKIMEDILVAQSDSDSISFYDYRTKPSYVRSLRNFRHYKNLRDEEFKILCIRRCEKLSDDYRLGIRGLMPGLLDKYQMIREIESNTLTGQFLVRRYRQFLETMEDTWKQE